MGPHPRMGYCRPTTSPNVPPAMPPTMVSDTTVLQAAIEYYIDRVSHSASKQLLPTPPRKCRKGVGWSKSTRTVPVWASRSRAATIHPPATSHSSSRRSLWVGGSSRRCFCYACYKALLTILLCIPVQVVPPKSRACSVPAKRLLPLMISRSRR